jgi:hypothetical protein
MAPRGPRGIRWVASGRMHRGAPRAHQSGSCTISRGCRANPCTVRGFLLSTEPAAPGGAGALTGVAVRAPTQTTGR